MSVKGLERLRTLFAQEAEQRLGRLAQLVLDLESNEGLEEAGVIAEIFREVHTLKGSAAVVGFTDIVQYAHVVEERLGQLRSNIVAPTPPIIDALLVAIARLGSLIWEEVGDGPVDDASTVAALTRLELAFASTTPTDDVIVEPPAHSNPSVAETVTDAFRPVEARAVRIARPTSPTRVGKSTVMVPIERLDDLVRAIGEAATAHLRVGRMLFERFGVAADDVSEFVELARLLNGLQKSAMRTRMVPLSTITDSLQLAVRDSARTLGKDVRWETRGDDTELDRGVLHQLSDSLIHLVRNAIDHGIDTPDQRAKAGKPAQATVRLHAMQVGSEVTIAVTDDGAGIDLNRVRDQAARSGINVDGLTEEETMQIIFRAGFSTARSVTDISGRGVGLEVVKSNVDAARGRVEVRSEAGVGSEFRIVVPVTLAVLRCLVVQVGGQRFGIPLHHVSSVQALEASSIVYAQGRQMFQVHGRPLAIDNLTAVLGMTKTGTHTGTVVIMKGTTGRHAFVVEALAGQRDFVVKALSPLISRIATISGASVEPDGSILFVLDPEGLIEASRLNSTGAMTETVPLEIRPRVGRLLVVDDALTVRELQRSILERAGFEVIVAGDGVEALAKLDEATFDLVLTDVEMPRMDGFQLTEHIRAHSTQNNVGILILTSLGSDADRQRGMNAGADGYIVKGDFDEQSLLTAVERLIGVSA